jgi:heat shock protein HslJ/uncharacterized protein YecT (DUF1311 family)
MSRSGVSKLFIAGAMLGACCARAQAPIEECAQGAVDRSSLVACLDQRLRQATLQLNAALKAAQERVEQLEKENRRAGMSNFIDSQRKFNAYRDTNCTWQAVRAAPGSRGEEFVKDCQIRATLAREQELLAFARDEAGAALSVPVQSPEPAMPGTTGQGTAANSAALNAAPPAVTVVEEGGVATVVTPPQPPVAARQAGGEAQRGVEWRLASWLADGLERALVPDSSVTISFDPAGRLSGNASVNRFNGRYRFNADGDLEWPRAGFSLTRMSGPPGLMRQERAFFEALRRTRHYRVEGGQLVLESADSSVVLTFVR